MGLLSHSTRATELLIKESGKKLLLACATRWSYNLLALEWLLELKQKIAIVTDQLTMIDNLRNSDWIDIEQYVKLLKPFANCTYSIEGQNYTTISEIIPQLLELKNHCSEMKEVMDFKEASKKLMDELCLKFDYILSVEHYKFEVIYTVVTALDPHYSLVLRDNQLEAAKGEILHLLGHYSETSDVIARGQENNGGSNSLPSKLKFVSSLVKAKHQKQQRCNESTSPILKEVTKYFLDLLYEEDGNRDPVDDFWPKNTKSYPLLAVLAMDVLVIPATSAPAECVFSQASIALAHQRVRLTGHNLEHEVMLKCNRCFI